MIAPIYSNLYACFLSIYQGKLHIVIVMELIQVFHSLDLDILYLSCMHRFLLSIFEYVFLDNLSGWLEALAVCSSDYLRRDPCWTKASLGWLCGTYMGHNSVNVSTVIHNFYYLIRLHAIIRFLDQICDSNLFLSGMPFPNSTAIHY